MSNESENDIKLTNFIGFDFSTQQLKAIIINAQLEVLHEAFVHFDSELPEYRTHGGVITHEDDITVTAPTIMWIKALDMLMDKLRVDGAVFTKIAALSGAAQQHGSVYWKKGSSTTLANLNPDRFMHEQLAHCFSVPQSPIWMDLSTSFYSQKLEEKVGGPQNLANMTGSRAYERQTGCQIAKIFDKKKDAYENTERISLVSSFGCSLFLGNYAPIDFSDGSGMNLLDISTKEWCQNCLEVCGSDLKSKLGRAVPSFQVAGKISNYFVKRYEFSPECSVVSFTGDNPSSLAGMCLTPGDVAISLGTSDTLFLWLDQPKPQLEGNIFINPVDEHAYMALLAFKNGSTVREKIRDQCANGSWDIFNQLLDSTPRGNFGNIGMYYFSHEITPAIQGVHRFNKSDEKISRFTSHEVEVRALIEGQFIAKKVHAENLGLEIKNVKCIYATGGASQNKAILQVLSDVFNSSVYTMKTANSACLGSAYRAKHGIDGGNYVDAIQCPTFTHVCSPHQDSMQIYNSMTHRFRMLEDGLKKL